LRTLRAGSTPSGVGSYDRPIPVVEILVGSIAGRFVGKLGERWLDSLVEYADQKTRELLRRLFENPDDLATREELVAHLEADPVETDKLIARAAPALEQAPTKIARVRHFIWVLNWTLERVDSLQRPVALPGFLSSPDCVSIYDTRPLPDYLPELTDKEYPDEFDAGYEQSADPVRRLYPGRYTGVRLIQVVGEERDGLVAKLNDEYEEIGDGLLIHFPPGTRTVDAVAWNRIELVPLERKTERIGDSDLEWDVTPLPSDEEREFCRIRGPEGMIAMRDGLFAQLAANRQEYATLLSVDFDDAAFGV
jgi:hypothetical protein